MNATVRDPQLQRAIFIALVALTSACGPTFDVPLSADATVPAMTLLDCGLIQVMQFMNGVDISTSAPFKNQGATKDNIESVTLTEMTLVVTTPSNGGLGFLKSIDFVASDPAGVLPDVQVAHEDNFSGNPTSVTLTLDPQELAPYAELPSLNLKSNATVESCVFSKTIIQANLTLHVVAKGL